MCGHRGVKQQYVHCVPLCNVYFYLYDPAATEGQLASAQTTQPRCDQQVAGMAPTRPSASMAANTAEACPPKWTRAYGGGIAREASKAKCTMAHILARDRSAKHTHMSRPPSLCGVGLTWPTNAPGRDSGTTNDPTRPQTHKGLKRLAADRRLPRDSVRLKGA